MSRPIETPCREWRGCRDRLGYGHIKRGGRNWPVHRWIMHEAGHDIDGMVVMHLCDNPPCYRYDHLRVGTVAENNADKIAKGRGADQSGEANGRAILTEADVRAIRADTRTYRVIAAQYGVSTSAIAMIRTRRNWKHVA